MGALGSRTSGWAEGGQGWEQGTGTHTKGDRQTDRMDRWTAPFPSGPKPAVR